MHGVRQKFLESRSKSPVQEVPSRPAALEDRFEGPLVPVDRGQVRGELEASLPQIAPLSVKETLEKAKALATQEGVDVASALTLHNGQRQELMIARQEHMIGLMHQFGASGMKALDLLEHQAGELTDLKAAGFQMRNQLEQQGMMASEERTRPALQSDEATERLGLAQRMAQEQSRIQAQELSNQASRNLLLGEEQGLRQAVASDESHSLANILQQQELAKQNILLQKKLDEAVKDLKAHADRQKAVLAFQAAMATLQATNPAMFIEISAGVLGLAAPQLFDFTTRVMPAINVAIQGVRFVGGANVNAALDMPGKFAGKASEAVSRLKEFARGMAEQANQVADALEASGFGPGAGQDDDSQPQQEQKQKKE